MEAEQEMKPKGKYNLKNKIMSSLYTCMHTREMSTIIKTGLL